MSVGTTALVIGGLAAAGSVGGAAIGAHASGKAADQQAAANQAAIDEQRRQSEQAQQNSAPYLEAGKTSIGRLMQMLESGHFNVGDAPKFTGEFHTPTLEEARATPGYQFTRDEGAKLLERQAAAKGQVLGGGQLQALDRFGTGLADSTYNDVFNRSLSTYNAGLSGYQAQLAGYGADLAGKSQEFGELFAPAQLGSGQANSINSLGANSATSIGQLMQGIGNAQASGTVGTANSINSGIGNATSGITDAVLLKSLGILGNQSKAVVRPGDEFQYGGPG